MCGDAVAVDGVSLFAYFEGYLLGTFDACLLVEVEIYSDKEMRAPTTDAPLFAACRVYVPAP